MEADEVVRIVELLEAAGIPSWIDGGWGVDALLEKQTRPHSDLDLVIPRVSADHAQKALQTLGYAYDPTVEPGLPARLVLRAKTGRQIDLHPIMIDELGNGWQEIQAGAWGLYPADGLGGKGAIAGQPVNCLTPDLQLLHHLCYVWNEKDRQNMAQLAARFGLQLPPESQS